MDHQQIYMQLVCYFLPFFVDVSLSEVKMIKTFIKRLQMLILIYLITSLPCLGNSLLKCYKKIQTIGQHLMTSLQRIGFRKLCNKIWRIQKRATLDLPLLSIALTQREMFNLQFHHIEIYR